MTFALRCQVPSMSGKPCWSPAQAVRVDIPFSGADACRKVSVATACHQQLLPRPVQSISHPVGAEITNDHAQVRLMLVLAPATCCLAGIGAHEALLLFAR